ncbi:MAG: LytTR family DNA-binding domain-containing protein [Bacteroidales bacterium]|nr:LytTR family DNA-binding domain-containing protein [Bacteroidales bacterium]MDD4216658.1 LytTR family DNA-binding domain-containing protein [Bacteroidales bacterium]MDY0141518.1 LytTR family DNA-binding domain-containing protein [Bacteroidales bacterium]
MQINCITIDDEPYALKQISDYVRKTPFLNLIAGCKDAFEALASIAEQKPDLIFVDINMPEMSGMELVKSLTNDILIIFTTAHNEYAVESYKVNAVDYLLKPIGYNDFLRAANKAQIVWEKNNQENLKSLENKDYIFVKADGRIYKVELSKIDFIESASEYVKIFVSGEKPIMSLMTMKSLEAALPTDKFMRVHRSYIVNLDNITTIERNRIIYYNKIYVPVSEQYKAGFKDFVDRKFL